MSSAARSSAPRDTSRSSTTANCGCHPAAGGGNDADITASYKDGNLEVRVPTPMTNNSVEPEPTRIAVSRDRAPGDASR
jgi:hypothetical protein